LDGEVEGNAGTVSPYRVEEGVAEGDSSAGDRRDQICGTQACAIRGTTGHDPNREDALGVVGEEGT